MSKRIFTPIWIEKNTKGSNSVVELGAGFFNRLSAVNKEVNNKIGIEIYKPYIDNAKYNDCIKIEGDILNYDILLKDYEKDTVMIIDVLEHFDKNVGFELIERLKKDFNKIILMLPIGVYEQDKDVTGHGGHEYQTHKSYWYEEDVKKLNFTFDDIDEDYHQSRKKDNLDTACYFGVWEKNNNEK